MGLSEIAIGAVLCYHESKNVSMGAQMIRTQIQLTEEQVSILKKIASERATSIAQLVRQAVDKLIRSGAYVDMEEQRVRAIAAAGRFHSGVSDLSESHDKYLVEAFEE
jgi:CRISPR/Cas system-associated protein Csm6